MNTIKTSATVACSIAAGLVLAAARATASAGPDWMLMSYHGECHDI